MRTGSVAAAPFVGDQFVSLYLGATRVPTVPGAATVASAIYLVGDGFTEAGSNAPANDGGSEITGYVWYRDGVPVAPDEQPFLGGARFFADYSESELEVSAVNAIGEGPKSDPFTVTSNA
jgi:hypothetical protein